MTITVNWETATSVTAAAMRAGLAAAMTKSAALAARDGCLRSGALAPTAAGGSMAVSIAAGQAMIAGYQFTNDATATVTLDVGGATARTDLIVARVYDSEAGDAQTLGAIEVVKGTSTTVPATPARAIALASVSVGASVSTISSGNLTDRRTWTTGAGGMLLLPGGLASTPPSGLDDGTPVWDSQAHQIGVKEGTAWRKFTDVGSLIGDTTPVNITVNAGFSGHDTPQAIKRAGVVYLLHGFNPTGITSSLQVVGNLPVGYRPTTYLYVPAVSYDPTKVGSFKIDVSGDISLRNNGSNGPYYHFDGVCFPAA